ncbi:YopD family type III secretion system translocon subunit [Aeromonas salmonicida]|uniref:YopD family type III secretion system translocon subunit n=1 Tax=Aeromonas salmonicida TaxID=645 RepID=UPI00232BB5F5|nr:YopD family type III secretion system translocon subunit [Aeromonas salmonicida]WCH23620.1 YopD family type III secretion system translocon subunit [Aeromonas salmonicida]
MNINENTCNPVLTRSFTEKAVKPFAPGRPETIHAAGITSSGSEITLTGRPDLPPPTQRLDSTNLGQVSAVISETVDMISELFLFGSAQLEQVAGVISDHFDLMSGLVLSDRTKLDGAMATISENLDSMSALFQLDRTKLAQDVALIKENPDDHLDLLSQLFLLARLAREMGLTQRDQLNNHVIRSQTDQVAEMRHGAKLMIAMAVVSGVMAGFSAITGALNLKDGAKAIKQQNNLEKNMAIRDNVVRNEVANLRAQGQQPNHKEVAKAFFGMEQQKDRSALNALKTKSGQTSVEMQTNNTVSQSVTQMSNSAVQVAQGESQAKAKEDEVMATIHQTEKQKVEDNMAFNANFMKDVLQLMQQYSQTLNQTLKAAFGVA